MRTTLTLDDDVFRRLEDEAHRQRRSFKDVVNEALRVGLGAGARSPTAAPVRLRVEKARLLPGLDRGSLNRLADELETETAIASLRRRR